jgi:hypothetical protein
MIDQLFIVSVSLAREKLKGLRKLLLQKNPALNRQDLGVTSPTSPSSF